MAAAVLETFLGGMETGFPLRGPSDGGDLETFLGGMETSSRPRQAGSRCVLETFLGGMETDGALNASYSGEGP